MSFNTMNTMNKMTKGNAGVAVLNNWSAMGTTIVGVTGSVPVTVYGLECDTYGSVYVGGNFSTAGGVTVNGIAKYTTNTKTWNTVGSPLFGITGTFIAGTASYVRSISCDGSGNVFVGGNFTNIAGVTANNVAKYNTNNNTWSAMGGITFGVGGPTNPNVRSVLCDGSGNVFVGGFFNTAGGVTVNNVAKYNTAGDTWYGMGGATTGVDSVCISLADDGTGNIYAGGAFTKSGGATAIRISKYNVLGNTWSALGSTGINSNVNALACDTSGNVFAGGGFTNANGVAVRFVAQYNTAGNTWTTMNATAGGGTVNAMKYSSGKVFVGSNSTTAGNNVTVNYISTYNILSQTWSAMGTSSIGVNGQVNAVSLDGVGNVFAGGVFTANGSGTTTLNCVAKYS